MRANELRNYLSKNLVERGVFSYSELDEVILTVYNIIDWSIRDQCDIIEVYDERVVWRRFKKVIDQLPTSRNFKPAFEKIRRRDKIIQSHLKLIEEADDKTVYKIMLVDSKD